MNSWIFDIKSKELPDFSIATRMKNFSHISTHPTNIGLIARHNLTNVKSLSLQSNNQLSLLHSSAVFYHWSTYERETYVLVKAFKKLDHLLTCGTTTGVFTYHRRLLFTFNPVAMYPSLGRHKVLKVLRWAVFLSEFKYRMENVPEDNNIWPDIMNRLITGYREPPAFSRVRFRLISVVSLFLQILLRSNDRLLRKSRSPNESTDGLLRRQPGQTRQGY